MPPPCSRPLCRVDALLSDVLALPASLKLQLADGGEFEFSAAAATADAAVMVSSSLPAAAFAGLLGVFGDAAGFQGSSKRPKKCCQIPNRAVAVKSRKWRGLLLAK